MSIHCPRCGRAELAPYLSTDAMRMETILRAQFVADRLEKAPRPEERKDLTDFAHGSIAALEECQRCRILIRVEPEAEPEKTYVEDEYDESAMTALLPRYVAAFREKQEPYRTLLSEGAKVLEIGPHLGAFLDVAGEWGWDAEGVDIGRDTTRFLTSRGHTVHNRPVQDCSFHEGCFDGVFIWNCFEQIPDPHQTLAAVHRILKPGGVMVLRTPNALFYRVCQDRLRTSPGGELALWIVRALGYNNLLAFPYLYGYESESLLGLAGDHAFHCHATLNSELIIRPFPELHGWIEEEHRTTLAMVRAWSELEALEKEGRLTAPWMEIIYRRD